MVDDMRRDKTLNTVLKTALPVPGAYIEDVLTIHGAPCLHSPSVPKLSLPEPAVSTMPCAEICESPVQDDNCTSFVKGSPEDPQSYDAAGYVSDQSSVCFAVAGFQDMEILTVYCELIRTPIPGPMLMSTAKTKAKVDSNIAGQLHTITKDLRWGTGHLSFHQNDCQIYHPSPPINYPENFLHSRGHLAESSLKMESME